MEHVVSMALTDREEILLMRIKAGAAVSVHGVALCGLVSKEVKALESYGLIERIETKDNRVSLASYKLTDSGYRVIDERATNQRAKKL
jgi:hypothetical protein